MGKFMDWIFPRIPEEMRLAADIDESGLLRTVPDPPNIQPTSSITKPISVLSGIDMMRMGKVTRKQLRSIPAFRRAITLITGTAGSLPYHAMNSKGERVDHSLLSQPESPFGFTRSVTMTRTAEDILLDGASLWIVQNRDSSGFATSARRIPFDQWYQDEETGVITVDGVKVPNKDVRLFTSLFDGLCEIAGPTVYLISRLNALTVKYANNPQAREIYKSTDGGDHDEDEIADFLQDIQNARELGVAGWLPSDVEMQQVNQMTPEQMMLVPAQEWIVTEVSRLTGIDASWLNISQSTRTYSNIIDERRNFLDFVVMPQVILPIEERLSLDDMTPRGQTVKCNVDAFLRMNTLERMQAYEIGSRVGAYDPQRIAELENLPRVIMPPNMGDAQ